MNCIRVTEKNYTQYFAVWENFIQQHPKGNIFQSPLYYSIFRQNKKARPVAFLLIDENNLPKGVLVSIILYQVGKPFRLITSRSIIQGGPITENDNPQYASLILRKYSHFIKGYAIYSQFRNLDDISGYNEVFETLGYRFEEHLNIQVDLTKNESQLWKEINTKRRNEIRKAEKEGLTFKILDTPAGLEQSYIILQNLYKSIRLPLYNRHIFGSVFSELVPVRNAQFFGAYYENTLVGTMYAFCYKGIVYNWYAGSVKAYNNKCPNDFLPWKIFLWAKEQGFTTFDWGGAGKPCVPYGVREYKSKFGGTFVNYGRYEKIHFAIFFKLAKVGFKVWQALKF